MFEEIKQLFVNEIEEKKMIASFDIGKKNFCFCIGSLMRDEIIYFKNTDISKNNKLDICLEMYKLLENYKFFWDKCSIFLIEKQMNFGYKRNNICVRLEIHLISFLLLNYKKEKKIIEYPAYNKTRVYEAPQFENTFKRKKWAVKKAIEILIENKNDKILNLLKQEKKKDDIADCILMIDSYKILNNKM